MTKNILDNEEKAASLPCTAPKALGVKNENECSAIWAKRAAEQTRSATVKKIYDAMKAIEVDIQANGNCYPFNDGAVTELEVGRRAELPSYVLQSLAHRTSTKMVVRSWLEKLNNGFALVKN